MNNSNKHEDGSLHLTKQPPTDSSSSKSHVSNMSPSAIIDNQAPNDERFTLNDATLLKNRLSEVTTLRNPSNYIPPPLQQHQPSTYSQDDQHSQQDVWWVAKHDQDGLYSICGLLFLFGFVFPPFWWIGSIWPKQVREKGGKMAERWQKLNRIMSIGFSSILAILIIVFVVLYATRVY